MKIPKNFTHVQQTSKTCASACLAMLLGESLVTIVNEFHDKYLEGSTTPYTYLKEKGLYPKRRYSDESSVEWDKVYLLAVPSLNMPGAMHSILLDTRYGSAPLLYDPQKGASKFYQIPGSDEGGVDLLHFVIDAEFDEESFDEI